MERTHDSFAWWLITTELPYNDFDPNTSGPQLSGNDPDGNLLAAALIATLQSLPDEEYDEDRGAITVWIDPLLIPALDACLQRIS